MKIYISGPISGYENSNRPAFNQTALAVRALGHLPVIPHDIPPWPHDGPCPRSYAMGGNGDSPHSAACFLRGDLSFMLRVCDALLMLKGWEASVGARLEHQVAASCGMPIYYSLENLPVIKSVLAQEVLGNGIE